MPYTIAVAHHAGGVGKTTTALSLGYALAAANRRVLIVDLDPQADLSDRLGADPALSMLAGVLVQSVGHLRPARYAWDGIGFDVVPSSLDTMSTVDLQLVGEQMREFRLRYALAPVKTEYDYILLDCPPALSLLTVNALYAADGVIIPCQAQDKSVRQIPVFVGKLLRIQQFRDQGQPPILGILLTMVDDTIQATSAERDLRAGYEDLVFTTTIPRRTAIAADSRYQSPVGVYAATNSSAVAYGALAQEVITRVENP